MRRILIAVLVTVSCLSLMGSPALAEEESRYEEFIKAPATSLTVRSMGLLMLALPHERENVQRQLEMIWWANNPFHDIEPVQRELGRAELNNRLDEIEKLARKHRLETLEFSGFTTIGNLRNLDLYYVVDTQAGPMMFRATIYMPEDGQPIIFALKVYQGFEESREAAAKIQHPAGKRTASVTYQPKEAEGDPQG